MSPDSCLDYDKVKAAVLPAFELVPEAHRQQFCRFKKTENQTYCEFAHEKETLFDRWCYAKEADDFEKLRNQILLEEFKNCPPERIVTYISKQKVSTVSDAAILADEYVLTHRDSFERSSMPSERSASGVTPFSFQTKQNFQGVTKNYNKETVDVKDETVFIVKSRATPLISVLL